MKIRKVAFYYFTGTGNTLLVVYRMTEVFRLLNVEVRLHNIVNTEPENVQIDRTIGIAFPVACLSTYPLVWNFIRNMPEGNDAEIFMVNTMGRFSGVLSGMMHNLLKSKGYNPIGAQEIVMPNNIRFDRQSEMKISNTIEKGMNRAKYYTHDLVYGISKWKPLPLLPKIANKINLPKRAFSYMAKNLVFSVDNMKCIRCGICYKLCPVDNIVMEEYPEYLDKCQFCLRCISFCPTQAIGVKNKGKFHPYTAVGYEEILK